MARMNPTIVGEKFHYLTVIDSAESRLGNKRVVCQCDCGKQKTYLYCSIKSGKTKSCGCMSRKLWVSSHAEKVASQNAHNGSKWIINGDIATSEFCGITVTISAADLALVENYRWHAHRYVYGTIAGSTKTVLLHRVIAGAKKGQSVDHANGDTYDNRRENIRLCTHSDNMKNRRKPLRSKGKYKGVFQARNGKWYSQITANGARKCLGTFESEVDAAVAYDTAAKQLHGIFAKTNF